MEMKLPIGFRFRPTDEELVVHYLTRKAQSLPLPASVIPELDVLHSDPWSIPGESSEKRYYFWKNNKNNSNCNNKSATSCGYWKCNNRKGKEKQIIISLSGRGITEKCSNKQHNIHHHQVVVGTRKLWTFYSYKGKQQQRTTTHHHHASKTRWVLHEFHLPHQKYRNPNCQMLDEEHDDSWVVCRLFKRKKGSKCHRIKSSSHSGLNHNESPNYIEDSTMDNNCTHQLAAAAAASPCSSDITTVVEEEALQLLITSTNSTNEDDQDHGNTACSSSYNY